MAGAALGRLWDTHPKVAFILHLLVTAYLGALAVWLFVTGATGGGVVLTIGFAVMAGSLVLFTLLAAQNSWQSDETSYDGRGQVVSPRAAWTKDSLGTVWGCLSSGDRASSRQKHRRGCADPRGFRARDHCDADGLAGAHVGRGR